MRIALVVFGILSALPPVRAEDLARIYVYAQFDSAASSWLAVSCDNAVVAKVKRGRFFAVDVAPGRHVLSIWKAVPVVVEVRAGQEDFVRLDWHYEVFEPSIPVLHAVQPDQAHTEMLNLAYIDGNKAVSKSVPKADPRRPPQLKLRTNPSR